MDSSSILQGGPMPSSYTSPALTANLVCRVLFGLLANLVCLVPLRLLYRNGEFAAAVFIANMEVQNLRNVVKALIWHDDNMDAWWPGYGLCDLDPYLYTLSVGLYATCLLAIMRNLAIQVGSLRANPPSRKEKRRRNIIQALIIFPLPLIQTAWTYPVTLQRYYVGTLIGCSWMPAPTWPFIVFMILPPALVSLVTTGYAILIYIRFREIAKTTQSVLSNNRLAHSRNRRARRRLYLMVVSILIPFLPIVLALTIINIIAANPLQRFDFHSIHHHGPEELPWNTIVYLPSSMITWGFMNICYIPIITAIPVFVFFGMTKDAMNCYRVILLYMGLGKVFPRLYEEYNPDSRAMASGSNGGSSSFTASSRSSKKRTVSSSFLTGTRSNLAAPSIPIPLQQQQPPSTSLPIHNQDVPIELAHRNPFLFRTRLNFSLPFKLSLFKFPQDTASSTPLEPLTHQPTHRSGWSDEESQLFVSPSSFSGPAATTAAAAAASKQTYPGDNDGAEKMSPAIMALPPPVLLFNTTTGQADGQSEH